MARVAGTLTGTAFASGGKTGPGLLVFGGQPAADAAATTTAYSLTASAGSVSITGAAAPLALARRLTASPAAITITGGPATFAVARVLSALAASYSITGSQAQLVLARILSAAPADYTISGDGATLDYAASTHRTLDALAGTIEITGASANFAAPTPKGGGQHGTGRVVETDLRELILRNDDEIAALLAALL